MSTKQTFDNYQRRTTYVATELAQRIRQESAVAGMPVSEWLRTVISSAITDNPPIAPEPPGPQTEMLLVYLRPTEDLLVRGLAHRYHITLASTLRRLIAAYVVPEVTHE